LSAVTVPATAQVVQAEGGGSPKGTCSLCLHRRRDRSCKQPSWRSPASVPGHQLLPRASDALDRRVFGTALGCAAQWGATLQFMKCWEKGGDASQNQLVKLNKIMALIY